MRLAKYYHKKKQGQSGIKVNLLCFKIIPFFLNYLQTIYIVIHSRSDKESKYNLLHSIF